VKRLSQRVNPSNADSVILGDLPVAMSDRLGKRAYRDCSTGSAGTTCRGEQS
jgi:hypothetical protein